MTGAPRPPSQPELYDHRYADADRGDVRFYAERARKADGPTLELACGTGRVYLELLRAGVDADGIDVDPASLDRLRERAAEAGLSPSVREGDMTDLDVDRAYDLVVCPFNAVQHATNLTAQRATLDGVYDALAPGGRFVFDVFVPNFDVICETYGEWRETTTEHEGREYTVRTRTRIANEVEQSFVVETEACDPTGEVFHREEHELAMLPKPHVELLADESPFAARSVAGSFDGEPIVDGDGVQVWTLEKTA